MVFVGKTVSCCSVAFSRVQQVYCDLTIDGNEGTGLTSVLVAEQT